MWPLRTSFRRVGSRWDGVSRRRPFARRASRALESPSYGSLDVVTADVFARIGSLALLSVLITVRLDVVIGATQVKKALSPASVSVAPDRPQRIGAYPRHENHSTKKWIAHLVSEPMSYTLQHWACYHESHAPEAIALEGQIGMMSPGGGNWYQNGFFNFSVGKHEGRNFAVRRIRELDSGERASCEFVWELPSAWVRVRFMVVPGELPLYCSIRQVPKTDQIEVLKVRLACYPSAYVKNGPRAAATSQRTVKALQKATLDPAKEHAVVLYDEQHDLGVGNGVGGCGGLALPEMVGISRLEMGGYGCFWEVAAKPDGRELRFAFWAGLRKRNAELIPYLTQAFPQAEQRLRALDFRAQRMSDELLTKLQTEFVAMCKETPDTQSDERQFAVMVQRARELQVRAVPGRIDVEAENAYLKEVDEIEKLLWQVRMKWVFAD